VITCDRALEAGGQLLSAFVGYQVVVTWTGHEATALRRAARLSLREFAAQLGYSQRIVGLWSQRGSEIILRPHTQRDLNTMLKELDSDGRLRFQQLLDTTTGQHPYPPGGPQRVADNHRRGTALATRL
jgi:hypothetical protein